jgi:hypothetical protein
MNKLYIVVSSTLSPGLQIAQACHALRQFAKVHGELDAKWHGGGNNLVCLQAIDEGSLLTMVRKAACAGVAYAEFREPDLDGSLTAVAFAQEASSFLSSLPLALRDHSTAKHVLVSPLS